MTRVRPAGSPQGVPVAARVTAGWAVAAAVALLLASVAAASAAEGSTSEHRGPSWIAEHLTNVVGAVALPAAAPSSVHTPSHHLIPAADRTPQVLASFLLGLAAAVVIGGQLRRGRGTLPPLRAPPHRLSSR